MYATVKTDGAGATFPRRPTAVHNLFNLSRHLVSASHYRDLRKGAFAPWKK